MFIEKFRLGVQDALNIICQNKILPLGCRYNFQRSNWEEKDNFINEYNNMVIRHYADANKELWLLFKYLDEYPFFEKHKVMFQYLIKYKSFNYTFGFYLKDY